MKIAPKLGHLRSFASERSKSGERASWRERSVESRGMGQSSVRAAGRNFNCQQRRNRSLATAKSQLAERAQPPNQRVSQSMFAFVGCGNNNTNLRTIATANATLASFVRSLEQTDRQKRMRKASGEQQSNQSNRRWSVANLANSNSRTERTAI